MAWESETPMLVSVNDTSVIKSHMGIETTFWLSSLKSLRVIFASGSKGIKIHKKLCEEYIVRQKNFIIKNLILLNARTRFTICSTHWNIFKWSPTRFANLREQEVICLYIPSDTWTGKYTEGIVSHLPPMHSWSQMK